MRQDIEFNAEGTTLRGWLFTPDSGTRPFPTIVMAHGFSVPDIAELAEEVHRTKQPRVIRRADEDLAVIAPVKKAAKRRALPKKSPEDREAFWSSFGSWKDKATPAERVRPSRLSSL